MNIVLFTEIFDCGGIDTFIVNLIAYWPNKNDRFILIANEDYPGLEVIKNNLKDKIEIKKYKLTSYLKPFEKVGFLKKITFPILKYFNLIYNIFAIKNLLVNHDYDFLMVINGGYPGGDMCRSAAVSWALFRKDKPKSIHNFHNLVVAPPFYLLLQELFIDKLVLSSTSNFTTVSMASRNSMKNRPYLNNKEIKYIYNGISNIKITKDNNIRNELNFEKNIQICLMLATYEERKGHFFLLKAFKLVFKENPNVRLILCGYGSDNEIKIVKKYINDLELSSCVYTFNFRNDKENLISNSDLVLISSQEFESFGLTAIEAMSLKKPIVSTDVGGLPEVIGEGFGGFYVSRNDCITFSQKIVLLLSDNHLYNTMAKNGYNRYLSHFTADKMAKLYEENIYSCISKYKYEK
jgi:glycosyltransferase involved in cell wall biosynthesis